ncbi:MAG: GNAT family N-acetyltransferase [Dehalococcoidia bacterium]
MDDGELMRIQAETLFNYDGRGRIVRDNVLDGGPAPRLFVGRTLRGDVVRFGETLPDTVVRRLAALLEREPSATEIRSAPTAAAALWDVLESHASVAAHEGRPAYCFPDALPQPVGVVLVTDKNAALLQHTFPPLFRTDAARQQCVAVVRDAAAVSVCLSSRIGARAAEAEVETLPDFRGRGYAAAVTAGWGMLERAAGSTPLYCTSWENLASQGVARRVGLTMYDADLYWT